MRTRHDFRLRYAPCAFAAKISILCTSGAFTNNSCAFANSAFAISPFKCASRPCSSANVSKIPNLAGPIFTAYQAVVPGSFSASGCADFKNSSTSFSFPDLASSCAQIANLFMAILLPLRCSPLHEGDPSRPELRCLASQQIFHVIDLVADQVQFARQPLNLRFRAPIYVEI